MNKSPLKTVPPPGTPVKVTSPVDLAAVDLIKRLAGGVIAHVEDLNIICRYNGNNLSKFDVRANVADAPRIMGKGGDRFRALRFVMRAAGAKAGRNIHLEQLLESIKGVPEPFPKFKLNPDWPRVEIQKLLEDTCEAVFKFPCQVRLIDVGIGSAIFSVRTDPREALAMIEEATPCFENLFSGIGITNGCQVSMDIGAGGEG